MKLTVAGLVLAFCVLGCAVRAEPRPFYRVINTSDEGFNQLHQQFKDDIRITDSGSSWVLTGLCNTCSLAPGAKACACTKRMCFRATPSESFVCAALAAPGNLQALSLANKQNTQPLTLKFSLDSKPQWLQVEYLAPQVSNNPQ